MNRNNMEDLVIEGAEIIFRNFAGQPSQFNPLGARGFSIKFDDPKQAEKLKDDGWNIKPLYERDDDRKKTEKIIAWHLPCAIRYDKRPPRIYLVTSKGKTLLDEEQLSMLDTSDIMSVDVIVNPSMYDGTFGKGVKAYVKSMYVTIEEDPLFKKYGG